MLPYDDLLADSRAMSGGLGALAFAVLTGLQTGGATAVETAEVERQLFTYLAKLSDEDCQTLCQLVSQRLADDQGPEGRWY